jgi:hypothetical protein
MEKPYMIYNSGKAFLICLAGLFVVTPLATWVIYALSDWGSGLPPVVCSVLAGLSVLAGFSVDRRAKR